MLYDDNKMDCMNLSHEIICYDYLNHSRYFCIFV